MAAKMLNDVLDESISLECLFDWLSDKKDVKELNALLDSYDCSHVEFVSFFLNFLREQSSRIFQSSCSVETPRKNTQLRIIKNLNFTPDTASPQTKSLQKKTPNTTSLDLGSLHSFPTLSSGSSRTKSGDKQFNKTSEATPGDSPSKNKSRDHSFNKRFRRVKLFSDQSDVKTSQGNISDLNNSGIADHTQSPEKEKFSVSTPKASSKDSLGIVEYFNSIDRVGQIEISPQWNLKSKWKKESNHSGEITVSESKSINSSVASRSRSFGADSSKKVKDHKSNSSLSLGDFLLNDLSPNDSKKDKKNKVRRRINPTRVKSDEVQSNISQNTSFIDRTEDNLDVRLNIKEERQLLKMECVSIMEQIEGKNETEGDKDMKQIKTTCSPKVRQADPNLVTKSKELEILAKVYSFLLDKNYCQNIMIELCFIISLLVIQEYEKNEFEIEMKELEIQQQKYLNSTHNCVYFAVKTLWLQRRILASLNLAALKLFSENIRVEKFSPELKEFMIRAYCEKQISDDLKRQNAVSKSRMQGNVSFQYETDNKENFTTEASFHSFRKQRDLFYNILALWEANHLSSGWIFAIGLGSKIRALFSVSSDPINLLHLARLFRSQLIMSCCGENQNQEEANEEILQLLPSADPNKISRLRARLTSSTKRQGPCPFPDFTGRQEFYKDFIISTNHSIFHQYLKNSLCDEILHLNDSEFPAEMDEDDSCFDEHTQDRYLHSVNILRLLAKFLGFVEFFPYRSEKQLSDRVLNIHCSVRQNLLPLFDLESCIQSAATKHKLLLTIPWVVSYLAMIDPVSARLRAFQNAWKFLIAIYKQLNLYKSVMNSLYLKLTLGWLFQMPNFPSDIFYNVIADDISAVRIDVRSGLDSYDLVQENVLYSVCPFLNEINVILSEDVGCSVRHIRPVTTQNDNFNIVQASNKQLELRLEENFLHNQSSSTRKTIEFVTERIASIGIKHLVYEVIPKIKEAALDELDQLNPSTMKEAQTEGDKISGKCYNELTTTCEKKIWDLCSTRSDRALKALLSSDIPDIVIRTCMQIVTREAAEKIKRWTQSHVTLAMISKEFSSAAHKKFNKKQMEQNVSVESADVSCNKGIVRNDKDSHRLPLEGRGVDHLNDAWPASRALTVIRESIWKASEDTATNDEIKVALQETLKSFTHREDVIPVAEKTMFYLLVDLLVVLCIHDDVRNETMALFVALFRRLDVKSYPNSSLERIICPLNIALIRHESKDPEKSYVNLGKLLLRLMDEDLLKKEQVETQLISFTRRTWNEVEYKHFTKLVTCIHDAYVEKNGCDKFSLLLEWLIETLKEMNDPKEEFDD